MNRNIRFYSCFLIYLCKIKSIYAIQAMITSDNLSLSESISQGCLFFIINFRQHLSQLSSMLSVDKRDVFILFYVYTHTNHLIGLPSSFWITFAQALHDLCISFYQTLWRVCFGISRLRTAIRRVLFNFSQYSKS